MLKAFGYIERVVKSEKKNWERSILHHTCATRSKPPPYIRTMTITISMFRITHEVVVDTPPPPPSLRVTGVTHDQESGLTPRVAEISGRNPYWVTQKLPQICTVNLRIRIGKVA